VCFLKAIAIARKQSANASGDTFDAWVAFDGVSTTSIWASKLQ
jgi:hypothetical protein